MKALFLLALIVLSGCNIESPTYSDETYQNVDEYCDDYSSHLVNGAKRDGIRNGCVDNYRGDFNEST